MLSFLIKFKEAKSLGVIEFLAGAVKDAGHSYLGSRLLTMVLKVSLKID